MKNKKIRETRHVREVQEVINNILWGNPGLPRSRFYYYSLAKKEFRLFAYDSDCIESLFRHSIEGLTNFVYAAKNMFGDETTLVLYLNLHDRGIEFIDPKNITSNPNYNHNPQMCWGICCGGRCTPTIPSKIIPTYPRIKGLKWIFKKN